MNTITCVAVGNISVGRSTLLVRYTKGEYPSDYIIPSLLEEYAATLTVNGEPYTLIMYNPPGDDDYDRLRPLFYQNADVIMLCFSVVNPCSYENITEKWQPELHHFCPNVPIVLVGMMLDLRDDNFTLEKLKAKHKRPVTYNEGLEMQRKIGAVNYMECSALTEEGVKKVFHAVVGAALTPRVSENKHLKAAMKDGYVPHKDDLFLIHGPGGVGKSSLISMFLGKRRDLARVSTAVAEESLNVCPVRDVSTSMFTDKWELVDIDRQERMVAHTSQHLIHKKAGINSIFKIEHVTSPKKENNEENSASQQHGLHEKDPSAFIKSKRRFPTKVASKLSSLVTKSLTKSLGDDPDNIEALLERIKVGLMRLPETDLDLMLYYSIRLLDSGGQPQFHEVVSIILPAVTGTISVFKLSERLDVHGEVVFFKKGELANDPYKSYLTNEQVIRHDLLAIQSEACNRGKSETPNLAFVGTHLDQQDSCTDETPDQKDELLHSMITEILPEDVQQCIISNGGSLKQVTFRLNTRTPDEKDYETAKRLKEALMNQSHVKPKNIPLKWCYYEVALRKLMEKLGRQTLSLKECEFVGFKLGFDLPSLKACLNYLRDLHIISFYDVIPNVVFGSSQVILDKITEFITYSLELKKGSRPLIGVDRKFHQQGIFTLDILNSEACSKHYNKYFTPKDLLKILKSLFIVTEVGPGEYLMPCVLEVSDIFPSPSPPGSTVRSSFILHFSKKAQCLEFTAAPSHIF